MQIDKNSPIPLYRQVEQILEEKLMSEEWGVGKQLPTEKELSALFNVSAITVKRGVSELVSKGYLYRQRGKGTFVSKMKKEQDINLFISLTSETKEKHDHRLINFSIEIGRKETTESLGLQDNERVISIKRTKIENNEPTALECTYLPYEKFSSLTPADIHNELIYNVLKNKFNIILGRARLFIKPCLLLEEEAKLLQIEPGTPVFEWERFTYTKQEEVIEYSKFYVRQDKETYYTEVLF